MGSDFIPTSCICNSISAYAKLVKQHQRNTKETDSECKESCMPTDCCECSFSSFPRAVFNPGPRIPLEQFKKKKKGAASKPRKNAGKVTRISYLLCSLFRQDQTANFSQLRQIYVGGYSTPLQRDSSSRASLTYSAQ